MALVKDGVLLAGLKQASLIGLSVGSLGDSVVLTHSNRRVAVFNVGDQKLTSDWLSKTGQELTCPAVELATGSLFAVIINSQSLHVWNLSDSSIDRGSKTQLAQSAHCLFVINNDLLILYDNGSVGVASHLLYTVDSNSPRQQIIWSEQTKDGIIAVFRDKSRPKCDQYLARLYSVNQLSDLRVHVSEISLSQTTKRTYPVTFCLQSNDSDQQLITMYSNGHLSRTSLTAASGSSLELTSPPLTKQLMQLAAVVAIDATQLALVGVQTDDNPAVGIGIWDTNFGIFHSWVPLPDTRQSNGQLFYVNRKLFLSCVGGVYTFGVVPKTASLMSCVGKTPLAAQLQSTAEVKKLMRSLYQLAHSSQTPTYEAFKSVFSLVSAWLTTSNSDDRLRVLPLVNAVVLRCSSEKAFWPISELRALIEAKLVTRSVCHQLCSSLAAHDDVDSLVTCLVCTNDIPESAIVAVLSCFLSADESRFSGIEVDISNTETAMEADDSAANNTSAAAAAASAAAAADDDDTVKSCDPVCVFSEQKSCCINQALALPFNDTFLLESLHRLNYTQVLNLIRHLEYLLCSTSALEPAARQPSLTQVIDWLSLLIDAHYPQMAVSTDTLQLHDRLQAALLLQRQDVEIMCEIDKQLLYILNGKKQVESSRNVGSYCITMLHID